MISGVSINSARPRGYPKDNTMRIQKQTDSCLVLTGIPGRRVWMIVLCCFGLLLTVAVGYIAVVLYEERGVLTLAHLPLCIGLLIAQVIFWTGAVTLAVGRLTLILDTTPGVGEYRIRSPIVEAGKPCSFKLEHVDSIALEATNETRPGNQMDATVHRVRLRLTRPRRAITLDETENNRLERLETLAKQVANFLGKTPVRVDHRGTEGVRS
jgi:hypothetical protein